MYFKSRADAGRLLAAKLEKYDGQACTVIALNPGGVLVGAQIALKLHAQLTMLLSDAIVLPGEHEPLANMTTRTFTFNSSFSSGQINEFSSEYRGVIEQQRIAKMRKLNMLTSDGTDVNPKSLREQVIILVVDSVDSGALLDVTQDFLKPVKAQKVIIATPLATTNALDKMRLATDEVYVLSVGEHLMESDHYYDDNTIPAYKDIVRIMQSISANA